MERPMYTHRQMLQMLQITRSWTLSDPSGPLPPLPAGWAEGDEPYNNKKRLDTLPEHKEPSKLMKFILLWKK